MKAWAIQPNKYNMTPQPAWLTAAKNQIPANGWIVAWENGMWAGPYTKTKAVSVALEAHRYND